MQKQCILCNIPDCYLRDEQSIKDCPIHRFLDVLGGKWVMIILAVLEQPLRYGQIKNNINGITEKVLIGSLKKLEEYGFITKYKKDGKQLQSIYNITEKGKKALAITRNIAELGKGL